MGQERFGEFLSYGINCILGGKSFGLVIDLTAPLAMTRIYFISSTSLAERGTPVVITPASYSGSRRFDSFLSCSSSVPPLSNRRG